jgi:hypothetical protein
MDRPATTHNETTDVDLLVETDSKVLDMVRKDLSQEYLRLVTRAMQESLRAKSGGSASQVASQTMGRQTI